MDEESFAAGSVIEPEDRDELLALVAGQLRQKYEQEPTADDDGDFVLHSQGEPVWVRVRDDQPVIEIFACVATDVPSRTAAAVELALLNRDYLWSRWVLIERTVFHSVRLLGKPFVPAQLDAMLDMFFQAQADTHDDLVLRLRSSAA